MKYICFLLCAAMLLSGCVSQPIATLSPTESTSLPAPSEEASPSEAAPDEQQLFSDRDLDASYAQAIDIQLKGTQIQCADASVRISGSTATITKEGTYLLSGSLDDGSIVVDAGKDKVQLVLKGAAIHSSTFAPIYVREADRVFLSLAEGTDNTLTGGDTFSPDGDTNIDAVIFSKEDLTLNGAGALSITSPGGHGIVSKDSLRVTGGAYTIEAASHGLEGQDEISITGAILAVTAGKDGLHCEKEGDETVGTVNLVSGTYRITAQGDGISASGGCTVWDGDYQITSGGGSENGQSHAAKPGFGRGGGPASGGSLPAGDRPARGQKPNGFGRAPDREPADGVSAATQAEPDQSDANRMPDGDFPKMPQGVPDGSEAAPSDGNTVSAKGIKAANLTVYGGSFRIDSADDGLHTNGSLVLENAAMEIASGDDGIHADDTVTILSGAVTISKSYEGIEGKHIDIQGGDITLTADDDGVNAAGGTDGSGFGKRNDRFTVTEETPSILVSGGTLRITASGDGMDANGVLEITGGTVLSQGPTQGDTSILDYDASGTISGGTYLGTGASSMLQTFSGSSQGVITAKVGNQAAGTSITVADSDGNVLFSHTPSLEYGVVIFSAPSIQSGETYRLTLGTTTQEVTAK